MKCRVCNAEAAAGALFCQHCGSKLAPFDAGEKPTATATPGSSTSDAAQPAVDAGAINPGPLVAGRRRQITDVPEETLWEGTYSPKAMLGEAVGGLAASIALIVGAVLLREYAIALWGLLGLIVVTWLFIGGRLARRRLGVHYKMTNQMFYHRRGIVTRTVDRIEAIDIDDVTWMQGLFERTVNTGSIKISSRDRTDPTFWLVGVEDVEHVAKLIDKARRAERLRRGFLSVEQTNIDAGMDNS